MSSRGALVGVLCAVLGACAASASAAIPAWITYRHDGARSGIDRDSGSPVSPSKLWQSHALDGQVYGQPLVYGSRVYVATENDTVYALDAASGAVVWHRHLATAVDSTALPCGNIAPSVGITSTPAIDPRTGRIYVVADTWDGSNTSSIAHKMFALNLADGSVAVSGVTVDPPGAPAGDTPAYQLQRASLALDAGKVIVGYGGNDNDCGNYHGWLVAVPEDGGSRQAFEVSANSSGGAIWGAGNAPAIDSGGDIWIATGNSPGGSPFGDQESVVKLDSNLNVVGIWTPGNWQTLDTYDTDLGSSMPVLLPGGLVFQIGKQGRGYLLSSSLTQQGVPQAVCASGKGSWGGGIYANGVIYVTCSDGLHALVLNTTSSPPTFTPLAGWTVNGSAIASPIYAGGLVWAGGSSLGTNNGTIYGLDPKTGNATFSANLGGLEDFDTAGAGGGRLFVPNQDQTLSGVDQITAFQIASTPSPSPTSLALSSSSNPVWAGAPVTFTASIGPGADAGTVAFTDSGAAIPGCATVAINPANSDAQCTTTFSAVGAHSINAAYSGDQYYLPSSGSLTETVGSGPTSGELKITNVSVRMVRRKLRLKLTLSQPATLKVVILKLEPGRIVDGRCRPGARHGRRCHALRHRRTLHLLVQAGQHRLRPHMRRLLPGRYAIMLTAVGSDGRRSNSVTGIIEVRQSVKRQPAARIAVQLALLSLSLL